jgi:hypothetical protein
MGVAKNQINIGYICIYLILAGWRRSSAPVFCDVGSTSGPRCGPWTQPFSISCFVCGFLRRRSFVPEAFKGCRCRCRYPRSRIGGSGCRRSRLLGRRCSWCDEGFSTPSCPDHTRRKPKRIYLNHSKSGYSCRAPRGRMHHRRCWARVCSRGLRTPWRGRGRRGSGGWACAPSHAVAIKARVALFVLGEPIKRKIVSIPAHSMVRYHSHLFR